MLHVGLRAGLQKISLTISTTDPFAVFLRAAARVEPCEPFSFAVLTGNPSAPGRRHVFLLFNSAAQPVAVVKAGATTKARELITHEATILSSFAPDQSGLPKLRGACELDNVSAFAMDFIEGISPGEDSVARSVKNLVELGGCGKGDHTCCNKGVGTISRSVPARLIFHPCIRNSKTSPSILC